MSRLVSWRLALRLARRDALRNRGRSVLVLVMIALPVLAVTAADVLIQTQSVSSVEGLDRRIGAADAQVVVLPGASKVEQKVDPFDGYSSSGSGRHTTPLTHDEVATLLGGARLLEERTGDAMLETEHGSTYASTTEVDLRDPLSQGLFDLTSGRWPQDTNEVVVNQALLDEGYEVGDQLGLEADGAPSPVIVGIAESNETRAFPVAAGPLGSLGVPAGSDSDYGTTYLAAGGPVSWATVRQLNDRGATVLSRAVVTDPPPSSEIPRSVRSFGSGPDAAFVATAALVGVMALLEVVLLAGPAFAVTARRQARTLALMSVAGGTPAQSRRVILANGLVLGSVAAAAGVVLGIGAARVAEPFVQRLSDDWFGPFDVPWLHLAGVALFGLLSALLAAVVPAWIASRQDVVAVLAGRRADRPPSVRSPVLGLVLLGVGVAGSAYGATRGAGSPTAQLAIAASAVVAVLGMILLVPVVVVAVARLARRLPLSTRYAARDAARHRTRTVPAVAAVAATVAGVVALGIAVSSDEAENRGTYQAMLPMGMGAINDYSTSPDWTGLTSAAQRELPDADLVAVRGVQETAGDDDPSYNLRLRAPGQPFLLSSYGSSWGSSALVDDSLDRLPIELTDDQRSAARRVLADGGLVAFTDHPVEGDSVRAVVHRWDPQAEKDSKQADVRLPAVFVPSPDGVRVQQFQAVLSDKAAQRLDVPVATVGVMVTGDISEQQEQNAREALSARDGNSSFYVERGYQADDATVVLQLVLAALGGVLMLGGTLTATFLALSDARPDLATLAAVGASPRRRRWIAGSYALVIGFVGAVLGAVVGFIPGVAITYPLTSTSWGVADAGAGEMTSGPFLDVPWLMIVVLVIALPVVTAAVVGLCARSRLPLVARVD